jgi:hypothetical protein
MSPGVADSQSDGESPEEIANADCVQDGEDRIENSAPRRTAARNEIQSASPVS